VTISGEQTSISEHPSAHESGAHQEGHPTAPTIDVDQSWNLQGVSTFSHPQSLLLTVIPTLMTYWIDEAMRLVLPVSPAMPKTKTI
jgi:hypothetical protein